MTFTLVDSLAGWGVSFALVFIRTGTMLFAFPLFGSPAINVRLRTMLAVTFTFILLPVVGVPQLGIDWGLLEVVLAIAREVGVGLLLGLGTKFMFEAFALAGIFVGRQMGFGMSELIDPVTANPQSMVGQFWSLVAILMFIALDGHHFLIQILTQNYSVIPLGGAVMRAEAGQLLIAGTSRMFVLALQLGAPALMITFMMSVAVGVMNRAMPRLQVFFILLPLKLFIGIIAILISLQLFQTIFAVLMSESQDFVMSLLAAIRG